MRLTRDVALVGGGSMTGFGLSDAFDSHVYLLDGGDEAALIDCGMGTPAGLAAVREQISGAGVDIARVRRLFLTHYHTDHAGGARTYRDALGLSVAIGRDARPALEHADHDATSFTSASAAGFFPAGYEYPACPVDEPLDDGQEIRVGRLTVRFVATAGHCAGHGAYLVTGGERAYLFSGDAVFAMGRILLQAIPDCDLGASLASIRRMNALEFDALLPGHGPIALTGGHGHVAAAVATIDRLAVPVRIG